MQFKKLSTDKVSFKNVDISHQCNFKLRLIIMNEKFKIQLLIVLKV